MKLTWPEEFPPEFAPPPEVLALFEAGEVDDMSWHNDVAPSFGREDDAGNRVVIWTAPALADDREFPEQPRFAVEVREGEDAEPQHFETEDVAEAIRLYREQVARLKLSAA